MSDNSVNSDTQSTDTQSPDIQTAATKATDTDLLNRIERLTGGLLSMVNVQHNFNLGIEGAVAKIIFPSVVNMLANLVLSFVDKSNHASAIKTIADDVLSIVENAPDVPKQ